MSAESPYEIYPGLSKKRDVLENYRENLIQLGKSKMGQIGGGISKTDFVLLGIIQRSIELNKGFITLIDQWNLLCAAPIIRLQIDSLLRLKYLSTLEDSEEISSRLINGESINRFKDKEGKNLTDARLRDYARETFPWIDEVYKNTSKFIHFSEKHIFSSILRTDEDSRTVYFVIGNGSRNAEEKDIALYYDTMIRINNGIVQLIHII